MGNSESKVPLWEKYILTIQEAAEHFHIGEKKLRKLVEERTDADYLIMNGNRVMIKNMDTWKIFIYFFKFDCFGHYHTSFLRDGITAPQVCYFIYYLLKFRITPSDYCCGIGINVFTADQRLRCPYHLRHILTV